VSHHFFLDDFSSCEEIEKRILRGRRQRDCQSEIAEEKSNQAISWKWKIFPRHFPIVVVTEKIRRVQPIPPSTRTIGMSSRRMMDFILAMAQKYPAPTLVCLSSSYVIAFLKQN
jgi:hypothetical protein